MSREGAKAGPRPADADARLSIGALARATSIPVETLRTWEARYGYPEPERKPSGHRVYPFSAIARLGRISAAIALGHRAGEVVGASDAALDRLLASAPPASLDPPPIAPSGIPLDVEEEQLLDAIVRCDTDRVTRWLLGEWARCGPLAFLETRLAPLLRRVGEEWEAGRLHVRHEHWLSERVSDCLRSLRQPFERATGPLLVFASLPGEAHGLGLLMASLVASIAGCRVLVLGTETPVVELAEAAAEQGARAVVIGITLASRGPSSTAQVRRLRERLPRRTALLVGGQVTGLKEPRSDVLLVRDLRHLDALCRSLVAGQELPSVV